MTDLESGLLLGCYCRFFRIGEDDLRELETGEALAASVAINLALVDPWVKKLPSERALFRAEFVHHPWERQTVRVQGRVIYRRCSP